jgi:exodeoxyribonuclease VII small subunit
MSRRKATDQPLSGEPTFEQALSELEAVVAAMEEDQLPLEELVSNYEKGSALLARCESVLLSAKQRLERIADQPAGDSSPPAAEMLDVSPGTQLHSATGPEDADDDDDTIRLF